MDARLYGLKLFLNALEIETADLRPSENEDSVHYGTISPNCLLTTASTSFTLFNK